MANEDGQSEPLKSKLGDTTGSVVIVSSQRPFGLGNLRFIWAIRRWKLENNLGQRSGSGEKVLTVLRRRTAHAASPIA